MAFFYQMAFLPAVTNTQPKILKIETEAEIEEIDAEMAGDAAFDHLRLAKLSEELDACEIKLMELYELIDALEGL